MSVHTQAHLQQLKSIAHDVFNVVHLMLACVDQVNDVCSVVYPVPWSAIHISTVVCSIFAPRWLIFY
jgi:hypothetical protein